MEPFPLETDGHTTRGIPDISDSATDKGLSFSMFSLIHALELESKRGKSKKTCDVKHKQHENICQCNTALNNNLNSHVKSQATNKQIRKDESLLQKRSIVHNKTDTSLGADVINSSVARKVFRSFKCRKNPQNEVPSLYHKSKNKSHVKIDNLFGQRDNSKKNDKCAIITKDKIVLTHELAKDIYRKKSLNPLDSSDNRSLEIKSQSGNNTLGYRSSVPKVFVLKGSKQLPREHNLIKDKTHNRNDQFSVKNRSQSQCRPLCLSVIPADDVSKVKYEKSFGPFYFVQQSKHVSGSRSNTALSHEDSAETSNNDYHSASPSESEKNEDIFYDSKSMSSISGDFEQSQQGDNQKQQHKNLNIESNKRESAPKNLLREQLKRATNMICTQCNSITNAETQMKQSENYTEKPRNSPKVFKLKNSSPARTRVGESLNKNHQHGSPIDKNSLNEMSSNVYQEKLNNCDVIRGAISLQSQSSGGISHSPTKTREHKQVKPTSTRATYDNERPQVLSKAKWSRILAQCKYVDAKSKPLNGTKQMPLGGEHKRRRVESMPSRDDFRKERQDMIAKAIQTEDGRNQLSTEGSCCILKSKRLSNEGLCRKSHDNASHYSEGYSIKTHTDKDHCNRIPGEQSHCEEISTSEHHTYDSQCQMPANEEVKGQGHSFKLLQSGGSMQVVKATMDVVIGVNLRPLVEP